MSEEKTSKRQTFNRRSVLKILSGATAAASFPLIRDEVRDEAFFTPHNQAITAILDEYKLNPKSKYGYSAMNILATYREELDKTGNTTPEQKDRALQQTIDRLAKDEFNVDAAGVTSVVQKYEEKLKELANITHKEAGGYALVGAFAATAARLATAASPPSSRANASGEKPSPAIKPPTPSPSI